MYCGMCGDTGLQNGEKCPQPECRKANNLPPFNLDNKQKIEIAYKWLTSVNEGLLMIYFGGLFGYASNNPDELFADVVYKLYEKNNNRLTNTHVTK